MVTEPYIKKRIFPKKEKDFIREFMDDLKRKCGDKIWFFKSHGEPMQVRGIPDILMCYCGLFVGIEFKIMRKGKLEVTPYQEHNLKCINNSMGFGFTVWYDENNGQCGIGIKRFENRQTCVTFFVEEVLHQYTLIPCSTFPTIRGG